MDCAIRNAYRFMREYAGGIVGHNAEGALRLARAEALLGDAVDLGVAVVTWRDDPEPYDEGTEISADEAREKFASNEWTGPYGCVLELTDDSATASLWGIVVGPRNLNDPYCRVIQAELADEMSDDLRQAIGDARDARMPTYCLG